MNPKSLSAPRTPRLDSLRVPSDPSPAGMAGDAHVLWRLFRQDQKSPLESGDPGEEYRSVCDFMRLYATLRFYQLALLLGTTGSIVTALTSSAVQASFARVEILKGSAVIISLAFAVMEFRASSHWHELRGRANELADVLRFKRFPVSSRWDPLTTSGAAFYLHLLVASQWCMSLFLHV